MLALLVLSIVSGAPNIPDGPSQPVLKCAWEAYEAAKERGEVHGEILTVIDYSLPSRTKRLWVLDLNAKRVLFHELVAHGKNSGNDDAHAFSNEPGSLKSSLGLFATLDTYSGKHGYSLKLRGLDDGVNHRAEERAIVIHGADYVNPKFATRHGRLGRSWGCPALETRVAKSIIQRIKGGTAVFAYHAGHEGSGGDKRVRTR